jgi:hypothetical protein
MGSCAVIVLLTIVQRYEIDDEMNGKVDQGVRGDQIGCWKSLFSYGIDSLIVRRCLSVLVIFAVWLLSFLVAGMRLMCLSCQVSGFDGRTHKKRRKRQILILVIS